MMVNHLRYQVLMPFIIVDSKSLPLSVDSLVDSCRSTTFGMLSLASPIPQPLMKAFPADILARIIAQRKYTFLTLSLQ